MFYRNTIEMLGQFLHFNFQIYETSNYTGNMFGIFLKYQALGNFDILAITITFQGALTSLPPIRSLSYSVYLNSPKPTVSSTFFIDIFDWKIWIATFMICSTIILFLFMYVKLYKRNFNHLVTITMEMFSLSKETIVVKPSFKFCQTIFSIFMFCVAATFSSFLTTFLAHQVSNIPFHTLDEVMHQNKYSVCIDSNTMSHDWITEYSKRQSIVNPVACGYQKNLIESANEALTRINSSICENHNLVLITENESIESLSTWMNRFFIVLRN